MSAKGLLKSLVQIRDSEYGIPTKNEEKRGIKKFAGGVSGVWIEFTQYLPLAKIDQGSRDD